MRQTARQPMVTAPTAAGDAPCRGADDAAARPDTGGLVGRLLGGIA